MSPIFGIIRNAIGLEESNDIQYHLNNLNLMQYKTNIYGRKIDVPRIQLLIGEEGISYSYNDIHMKTCEISFWNSKIKNIPLKYIPWITEKYNCALVNCYRNEKDSISPHRDDESFLINDYIISVSLGETRKFTLSNNNNNMPYIFIQRKNNDILSQETRYQNQFNLYLNNGDIVYFNKEFNQLFKHSVNKEDTKKDIRYNITFRNVQSNK